MKKALPLVLSVLLASATYAQKKFSEGTISYDIVINSTSGTKGADYLNGTTVANYIKGTRSRTEMVSPLGTLTTLQDSAKSSFVILKEFGEQRYMITLSPDDWKDANKKYEDITYTYDPSATKTIMGYTCKKAVGHLKDGTTYTVWYTPDLVPEYKGFQYEMRTLPGLALEYEVDTNGQKVTYTVSKISFSPVPASKFDLPKAGFRVVTYAESKGKG